MSEKPTQHQLIEQLHADAIFAGLDESSLQQLVQHALWREFAAESVVFWEGAEPFGLYFLQYGWLKIRVVPI